MNSPANLLGAKLRRIFLLLALLAFPLLAPQAAHAQGAVAIATLTNNGVPTVTITGNQSFTLTLMVTTNFLSSGISYVFLADPSPGPVGFFEIAARDASAAPWPTPPLVCNGDDCLLNPSNDNDLGVTGDQFSNNAPPGTYTIAVYTFNALDAPIGQYTITTDRGIMTDRTGGGFNDVPFSATAIINVIPEPTTAGLALLGGTMLAVTAWRKRRA
jgi:PEP-CTERM motif-containing protein